jgi:hypothetical protein
MHQKMFLLGKIVSHKVTHILQSIIGCDIRRSPSLVVATRWAPPYNCSFYLEEGCWSWVELENLFRAYTGLASARDVLPVEVFGPHAFYDNLLDLFLTNTQLYTDHSSQLGGRTLYNGFLTYSLDYLIT